MGFIDDQQRPDEGGFLTRLARDKRGNTLAIGAAAMIPIIAMVGGAIDLGRAYLVKTRLQQACDAGVLAARKSMTGSALTGDTAAQTQGTNFFNANLRTGMYGAENVTFTMADVMTAGARPTANGAVHGAAGARVATSIMAMFGFDYIPMTATCEADLSVGNNDVMFVLDLTGSMACTPNRPTASCDSYAGGNMVNANGRWQTTLETGSRLAGLQAAVQGFYTSLNSTQPPGTRLRIGFLPYSQSVNVWGLLPATTRQTAAANYQTRLANFNTSIWLAQAVPSSAWSSWGNTETFNANGVNQLTVTQCNSYGNNQTFTYVKNGVTYTFTGGTNPTPTAPAVNTKYVQASAPVITQTQYQKKSGPTSGTGNCSREKRTANVPFIQRWQFTNWTYQSTSLPLTAALGGTARYANITSAPTNAFVTTSGTYNLLNLATEIDAGRTSGLAAAPTTLDGCVEERISNDSGIDQVADGSDPNMLWKPAWRELTFGRMNATAEVGVNNFNSLPYFQATADNTMYGRIPYVCPKAAQQLQVMTAAEVGNYVTATDFTALGYTYHDIGMLWAARLMSPFGPFAANHTPPANGKPVNRHIIFMTDGDMKPQTTVYGPYGIELVDRRVANGTTDANVLKAAHNARFLAACAAAKRDSTVWVVAFGPPLNAAGERITNELKTCATSSAHHFTASNSAALLTTFQQIAQKIGDLRLTS